jgi:Ca2+-binding RTX toxin-like protein
VLGLASGEGLVAFAGFESFVGSNYGDVLIGGAVGERMQGGFGADIMSGGAGGDTFAWSRGDVFTTAGAVSGVDHITDFNLSADTIDMRGALAGGTLAARDTAAGTVLSVLGAAGPAVDVVVLDGVHGINTAALASADWLLQ